LCPDRQQWKDPFGSRRCDVGFIVNPPISCVFDGFDAASLFIGFIDFYTNYWNWTHSVVSVRLGRAVSVDSPEILLKHIPTDSCLQPGFHVEDPFDTKKDLGLCLTSGGTSGIDLRREFTRASLLIAQGTADIIFAVNSPPPGMIGQSKKFVLANRRTESCT